MLQYVCHCTNVSFETLTSSVSISDNQRNSLFKSIENLLFTNATANGTPDNIVNKQIDFVKNHFQNKAVCFEKSAFDCLDITSTDQPDYISSFLKIKFPLLMGYSTHSCAQSDDEIRFKINKCLICNTFSHILAVNKKETVLGQQTTLNSENTSSNTSNYNLSHSATSLLESAPSCYNVFLLVNINQMEMVNDMEDFKRSKDYSHIYDLIFDSSLCSANNFDHIFGLDFQIKMESEIVKKVFVNRIEDVFVQKQQNSDDSNDQNHRNEEAFKLKFLNLVNSLLGNGEQSASAITDENIVALKKKPNEIRNTRRSRNYDNENILSASVFEMEELDGDSNQHFLSDEDDDYASNEEETTTTTTNEDANQQLRVNHQKTNILKKRNSNVDDGHQNQLNSVKMSITATKKYNKDLMANKYSCSLPRDIPVMLVGGGRLSTLKTSLVDQQSSEEENKAENENHHYQMNIDEKLDNQKRHKSRNSMTATRKLAHHQVISASNNSENRRESEDEKDSSPSNDVYEGDDELFEDDQNSYKPERLDNDDDATSTKDMGQAISNLASSIVLKDGRELFGGVPSRRVPINSISKSCFE